MIAESGPPQRFADGVYWVSLAALRSIDAIVPTIAKALDLSFYGGREPRQQLLDYLRGKSAHPDRPAGI